MTLRLSFALVGLLFAFAAAPAQSSLVPEILYLSFNEGIGTSTSDGAVPGVGSVPTLANGGLWDTSSPLHGLASIDASSATSAFSTTCTTNAPYTIFGPWTIEVVIRRSGTPTFTQAPSTIVASVAPSLIIYSFTLTIEAGSPDVVRCRVGPPLGFVYLLTIPQGALLGVTTHLAVSYDPATAMLSAYRNGQLVDLLPTITAVPIGAGPAGVSVGTDGPTSAATNFPGTVDEVRIWNSLRTQAELQTNAFSELMPTIPAVSMLRFAEPLPTLLLTNPPTYSVSGVIDSVEFASGLVLGFPSFDPLLGAPLTISGTFGGSDTANLSDILLAPCAMHIAPAPGVDELTITTLQQASSGVGDDWTFGAQTSAQPIIVRDIGQASPPLVQRVGAGSVILDGIQTQTNAGARVSLLVELAPGGNRLRGLAWDYVLPAPAPEARLRQLGVGGVEIGLVDVMPGAEIWNVFALESPIVVGTGPLFGLEFGTFQADQIALPLATAPFHVSATSNGTYGFSLPFPIISPGTTIDMLSAAVTPGTSTIGFISPVQRIVF